MADAAQAAAPEKAAANETGAPPPRAGEIRYAARPITVRTRGAGNLAVDLPRGRGVRVAEVRGATCLLEPAPADADLLRQFGVRRLPRYAVACPDLAAGFLSEAGWSALRASETARLRGRWPGAAPELVEAILAGEPRTGMTIEQAEEAVGTLVFSRQERDAPEGREAIWIIGRRPRAAELRQFTEGRERGITTRTFDDYLALKARARLRFRAGTLVAIEPPAAAP